MGDYSKTTIVGNVGKDPKITTFQDGGKAATLSVATNEKWKTADGESKVRTEWHNVVVRDANLIEKVLPHVKTGSKILVEGRNETRSYDKDGGKHYTTEVVVRPFGGDIQLLSDAPQKAPGNDPSPR